MKKTVKLALLLLVPFILSACGQPGDWAFYSDKTMEDETVRFARSEVLDGFYEDRPGFYPSGNYNEREYRVILRALDFSN